MEIHNITIVSIFALTLLSLQMGNISAQFTSPCACTREIGYVCGSNGETYSNSCEFRCVNFKYYGGRLQMTQGECKAYSAESTNPWGNLVAGPWGNAPAYPWANVAVRPWGQPQPAYPGK